MVVLIFRPNDFAASNGFGMMIGSLGGVLLQAFFVILVIVLISMAVTWIKTWIEKYLDQMLAKLDTLAAQKAERENAGKAFAVMNGNIERMEKKLDNIERILEKVAE
jgi:Tfp pilus assembly protein PilO